MDGSWSGLHRRSSAGFLDALGVDIYGFRDEEWRFANSLVSGDGEGHRHARGDVGLSVRAGALNASNSISATANCRLTLMRDPEEVRRRREFAEKTLERTFREGKEKDRRRRRKAKEAVEEAIAANPDKEPFSIERLGQFYNLTRDAPTDYSPSESEIEDYRYLYYIRYPRTNTVRELAEILNWNDSHWAN